VQKAVDQWGQIDVLILNAAKSDVKPFQEMEDCVGLIRQTMDINFMQCVYLTKYSLPHLLATRGIIVAVSSVAGLIGSYGSSGYAASKHAVCLLVPFALVAVALMVLVDSWLL
jgi:NAD(P)-dependent dehydrogenase (short-subunit alcohol dehydrogenase family)